jgi:hypothetical protein
LADIDQGVAAGVAQHMGVDRKGEAGAHADALDESVDGVRRERAAALGGEDEVPAQLAQRSHLQRSLPAHSDPSSAWAPRSSLVRPYRRRKFCVNCQGIWSFSGTKNSATGFADSYRR